MSDFSEQNLSKFACSSSHWGDIYVLQAFIGSWDVQVGLLKLRWIYWINLIARFFWAKPYLMLPAIQSSHNIYVVQAFTGSSDVQHLHFWMNSLMSWNCNGTQQEKQYEEIY